LNSHCFADIGLEPSNLVETEAFKGGDFLAPPPAVFQAREVMAINPNVPKVNVITGEYCDEECDLVVAGTTIMEFTIFCKEIVNFTQQGIAGLNFQYFIEMTAADKTRLVNLPWQMRFSSNPLKV